MSGQSGTHPSRWDAVRGLGVPFLVADLVAMARKQSWPQLLESGRQLDNNMVKAFPLTARSLREGRPMAEGGNEARDRRTSDDPRKADRRKAADPGPIPLKGDRRKADRRNGDRRS